MLLFIFLEIIQLLSFSKAEYFKIMSGKEVSDMTAMIEKLELNSDHADNLAYMGALKMRKSEYVKPAKAKLDLFKEGRRQLESAISKNTDNPEYRFLRLMIQEHAPKILKYHRDIEADAKLVLKEYDHLPADVKAAVMNYAKTSSSLKNINPL